MATKEIYESSEFGKSLNLALDTIPFAADIVDENGKILFLNSKLRKIFGEKALGEKCWELYKDNKEQCDNCPLKNGIALGETGGIETEAVLGGRSFFIAHTGLVYEGRNAYLEIFHDITEHITIEKQLRKYLAALRSAANAIIIADKEGNINWVNPAFTKLTGYSPEEVMGKNPRIFKSGKHDEAFYKNLWNTVLSGKVWHGETVNRRKDGSLYSEDMTITPIFEEGEIANFIAIKQDITERKKAQESIINLNENLRLKAAELYAANKELEAFSYSVSHDLRAPLRSIDGFGRLLQEEYDEKLGERGREFIGRLRAAAQRMEQLIDDLLSLSKVTRADMRRENADLSAIAREILLKLKENEPERNVKFVVQEGLMAKCDKRLIQAALENLLGNAWKFTSKHEKARIEFGAVSKDGKKAYFVHDDGSGFDPKYADKLFTPFQRLHTASEFKGTGIGLTVVNRIVTKHGGRVWAESEPEKGATFYFTLN